MKRFLQNLGWILVIIVSVAAAVGILGAALHLHFREQQAIDRIIEMP